MKCSVQLFAVLGGMKGTLREKLEAVRGAGFTRIEPCVSVREIPGLEGIVWPLDSFCDTARMAEEIGLRIVSAHLFGDGYLSHLDALREAAKASGLKAWVLKVPRDTGGRSLQQAAFRARALAEAMEEIGVEVWLHSEDNDIRTKAAGKTAYERMLDLCMGKVYAQVDVGWVLHGGEDPLRFLERNERRVRAVHYKDFAQGKDEDVTIGTGMLDCAAVFRFAWTRGIPQYLDQDHYAGDIPGELARVNAMLSALPQDRSGSVSYLNVCDAETGEVTVLAEYPGVVEAPNWMKTRDALICNRSGRLFLHDIASGADEPVDTGMCDNCNNDHVLSPDEKEIGVSHMTRSEKGFTSRVYAVPLSGGAQPRLVTEGTPSFLHGWSPDGSEMAYCAFRSEDGKRNVDVYAIPAQGGQEVRLTHGEGYSDGPEYSPDGKYIWYNTTASGLMQVWRMDRDGSNKVQMTKGERNNWFGHVSPDGKKVVYISYEKDLLEPNEHLPNMPVELWTMNADGTGARRLVSLFGGQGTINVNSWAPDSRRFAFVSYGTEK